MIPALGKPKLILSFAASLLLAGGLLFRLPPGGARASAPPGETEALPVVKVAARDIRQSIEVPGEFRPYQETDVAAKVRGYVLGLKVDVGDVVKKSQPLATLEIPELVDDLRSAAAAVAVARQQAARARAQLDDDAAIYQRLLGVSHERPELIAQQELDQARAKADGSLAALTAARSAIEQAEANQRRVQHTDAYSRIEAPFDGVITARMVDEGALVGAAASGNALFHLAQVDKLRLVLKVPESSVPDVAVGRTAHIEVPALGQAFDLPVSRFSHQLVEATRTMHVEVDFANADGRVSPGMYAQVDLPLKQRVQVLAVPLSALHERSADGAKVYVLDSSGRVAEHAVTTGLSGVRHVEIKTGLKAGELVVVDVTPRLDASVRYVAKRLSEG
jgi:RND family efflux transporter MFP subunit